MEALAILFLTLLVAPFIICIVLLVKRSSDVRRIQELEFSVSQLQKDLAQRPVSQEEPSIPEAKPKSAESPKQYAVEAEISTKAKSVSSEPIPVTPPEVARPKPEPVPIEPETTKKWAPKPIPPREPKLLPFLRSIGFWPPEELARKEAGLIQWWAPRIGVLLGVLTVIFASVYIGRRSTPIMRFSGLVLADFIVMGAGFYYLKKLPRFGNVLFAAGLVMLYVTCIAGYAAPPVRVIHHPLVGIALQFLVIIAIFVSSIRLNQKAIALLALALGYLSSIFSAHEGLKESALLSSLALYLVGLFFSRRFQWAPLLSISALGVYLPVPALAAFGVIGSRPLILPHEWSVLVFLLAGVSLLPASRLFGKSHNALSSSSGNALNAINTTLCLVFGYIYLRTFGGNLVHFYGSMAIVFSIWAILFGRQSLSSFSFQLFFLKGCALTALWVTNYFSGDIRWFALIVEALLVSWIASRSKTIWQEVASVLLWLLSFVIVQESLAKTSLTLWSFDWLLFLAYPILACSLFGFLLKTQPSAKARAYLYAIFAALIGLWAADVFRKSNDYGQVMPMASAIYALLLALLAFIPRIRALPVGIAASILLLLANSHFWKAPSSLPTLLALVIITLAFAYAVARHYGNRIHKWFRFLEFVFHASWTTTLYAYLHSSYQTSFWFPALPPLMSMAILLAARRPFRSLADTHFIPLAFLIAYSNFKDTPDPIGIATVVLMLGVLALPQWMPQSLRNFGLIRQFQLWRTLNHLIVLTVASIIAYHVFSWLGSLMLHCLLAAGFFALWRQHRRGIALLASEISLFIAAVYVLQVRIPGSNTLFQNLPWGREMVLGSSILCLAFLALGYLALKWPQRYLKPQIQTSVAYLNGFTSFIIIALALSYKDLSLDSYYTPLMALYSLGLVVAGIALKCKPYRLVGIIGLLLPLFRLFVYDIKETLYRIIAFAVLAVLSVLIGFLYHKFQTRIE